MAYLLMSGYVMKRQTSLKVAENLGIQPVGDTTTLTALVEINRYLRRSYRTLILPEINSVLHPQFKHDDSPHMLGVVVNFGDHDQRFDEDPKYKAVKWKYMELGGLVESDLWWDTLSAPRKLFISLFYTKILDLPQRVCLQAGYLINRKVIPRIAQKLDVHDQHQVNIRLIVYQLIVREMKAQNITIEFIYPNSSMFMIGCQSARIGEIGTKFPMTEHDGRMKDAFKKMTGLDEAEFRWDTVETSLPL